MVQLQEAVRESKKFLEEVLPADSTNDIKREGVELTDDSAFWLVTFTYWDRDPSPSQNPNMWSLAHIEKYKSVKLRAEDGEFFGVKNSDL